MHRPKKNSPAVLAQNRQHYERLLEMVGHHVAEDDVERVLRAAMLAANYAWCAPVGLLSDLRLERTVVRAVRRSGVVTVDGDRRAGRVLHVLSEAYPIGGHTRQVCAWMARDDRTSDVVLTNQGCPVPDRLVRSVRESGGSLHDLQATAHGLLDRAHALRELMNQADLVVLTVHPYDSIALAAVNLPGVRPPVIYANHADHAFWLGVAGGDVLADWRTHARALDVGLRRVPEERIAVLPLPVDERPLPSADAVRREIGLRPDATVAVTVAADWKVAPAWGRGMHQVVDRVLHWSPQLSVVLVGVSPSVEWDRLRKRYPGRVFPVGAVLDAAPYLALADVYLESYPVRAGTTPLEAAMAGLPVVALADLPQGEPAAILHTGSPGLDGRPVVTSADQFAVAVRRLVQDPDLRRNEGDAVRASVRALHDGPGWRTQLEALYERARSLPAVDVDAMAQESPTDDRYGAMLLSATAPPTSLDPRALVGPLRDLYDQAMQADLFALVQRDAGPSLGVRVAAGWEQHVEWATRLLALAQEHPRLRVSLPFAAQDDVQGSRTSACLVRMLEGIGQTAEDCGDLNVETSAPHTAGPSVEGELAFSSESLDWVEALLTSPCWEQPPVPLPVGYGAGPVPASASSGSLGHAAVPAGRGLSSLLT